MNGPGDARSPDSVSIRDLVAYDEFVSCTALQRQIWGDDFAEAVPAAILMVAGRTGGIIAGAFAHDGKLVGFVFGITGYVDGAPTHWSDMLGVHPDFRGQGIGQALKHHQRGRLLERGVTTMKWTFDPLEARNAFINFERLGVTSGEYIRDCYGASNSSLHHGLATDRLLVVWPLDTIRGRTDKVGSIRNRTGRRPRVVNEVLTDAPELVDHDQVMIRIPADIQAIRAHDMATARLWRANVRAAFEEYFGRGYVATGLERNEEAFPRYVLERAE